MSTPSNADVVKDLQPNAVWQYFAELSDVPRPSKKEEKVRAYILDLAKKKGFAAREDHVGNIVIEVPAKPGCEGAPITVLQGHLDMVCEKNAGTEHDFDNEGIRLVLDKDAESGRPVVRADGTTLGADNGIGVALGFAAACDPDVKHGPLEILLTIDEEMGMTGASALTPELFKGRRLVNLDSEEDTAIYIGCAGGCDTNLTWKLPLAAVASGSEAVRLTVSGLRGGHSGGDIHENRGNAIKILVATIAAAGVDGVGLVQINGGSKRNAIPREGSAVVVGPAGTLDAMRKSADQVCKTTGPEQYESKLAIAAEAESGVSSAAPTEDTTRLLDALAAIPSGVIGMHPKMPALVQTSNNVSTIVSTVEGDSLKVSVGALTRSSSEACKHAALRQIGAVGRLSGSQVVHGNGYPGWEPNPDSPLLAVCSKVYSDLFGEEANVTAIHAGLECGIIGERVPGMDTVSFGPDITGAHSPDEQVFVDSVQKIWKMLSAVLAQLAKS